MTDAQREAETFILRTVGRMPLCTAQEVYNATQQAHKPATWFMFLASLKRRRLIEHVVMPGRIVYRLTKHGRRAVMEE